MPEKKPLAMFPKPCAMHSVCVAVRFSTMSSTNCCVNKVSMSPTAATETAYGAITNNVSKLIGTLGIENCGKEPATLEISPIVFTPFIWELNACVNAVKLAIANSGDGIFFVRYFGINLINAMVNAVNPTVTANADPLNP
jgi:hypothetical protein